MEARIRLFADEFNFNIQFHDEKIEGTDFLRTINMSRDEVLVKEVEKKRNGDIYFTPLSLIKTLVARKTELCDEMLLSLWNIPDENNIISDAIQREYEATERAEQMEKLATSFAKYIRVTNKMTDELEQAANNLFLDAIDDEDDVKKQAAINKIKFQALIKEKKKKRSESTIANKSIENGIPIYSLVRDPNFTVLNYYTLQDVCLRAQREMSQNFNDGKIPLDEFVYNYVWIEDIEITQAKVDVINILFKQQVTYDDAIEIINAVNKLKD
jgi:hypothetical protein